MGIFVVRDSRNISSAIARSSVALMAYTIFVALVSIGFQGNEFIFAAALVLRTLSFLVVINFYASNFDINSENLMRLSLSVVIFGSLFITLRNFLTGEKAYYGYAQLASWPAPAISGFVLGVAGLFFLMEFVRFKDKFSFYLFLLSIALTFLTYSISGNISLLGG